MLRRNGCTIGCDTCDGQNNHPGHGGQQFLYKNMSVAELTKANLSVPAWGLVKGDMLLDPQSFEHPAPNQGTGKGGLNTTQGLCPNSAKTKATICDSSLRTLNVFAECGSKEDICECISAPSLSCPGAYSRGTLASGYGSLSPDLVNCGRGCVPALSTAAERVTRGRRCHVSLDYYSPWRAPGMAPVIDSCGSAGGRLPGQGPGGAGANYQNNSIAHLGMVRRAHGRRLRAEPSPPRATGTSRFW